VARSVVCLRVISRRGLLTVAGIGNRWITVNAVYTSGAGGPFISGVVNLILNGPPRPTLLSFELEEIVAVRPILAHWRPAKLSDCKLRQFENDL
jgi:hypothetical protein